MDTVEYGDPVNALWRKVSEAEAVRKNIEEACIAFV